MKKLLLTILFAIISMTAYAVDEHVIYQAWDNGAFEIYYVAAGTETAASVDVNTDSITFHVAGGFNPGDMSFDLADVSTLATYKLFQTSMTSWANKGSSTDTTHSPTMQGAWIVTIPNDVYENSQMSGLATSASVSCLGLANAKQLTVDASSTTVYSRYIPAMTNYKRTKIKNIVANFTATTPQITIYNSAGTQVHPLVTLTSGQPEYLGFLSSDPIAVGSGNERMEIRTISAGAISAGYLLIEYMAD